MSSTPTTAEETVKRSQLAELVSKALKREIPEFTEQELAERRQQFTRLRADFSGFCAFNQYYNTLALLSTCEIRMDAALPALAAMTVEGEKIEIMAHPLIVDLWELNKFDAFFVICHELRHIVQVAELRAIETLVDLEPIREVYLSKQQEATTQQAKDGWQAAIEAIDDKNNHSWKQRRYQIANVTMDAALHQDVFKLFPDSEERVNAFFRDRLAPYMSGFHFETVAKDMIASGTHEEFVENFRKISGPKKRKELDDLLASSREPINYQVLAEVLRTQYHLQTVATLDDQFRSVEGFKPSIAENTEWLQLADEYVRWLAAQVDKNQDANNPPQPQECSGGGGAAGYGDIIDEILKDIDNIDQHNFGDGTMSEERRDELERKVRDAIRRAQEESAILAHRAGAAVGDQEMFGDSSVALNRRIKEALEKMRIKFVKLFKESNEKRYTFERLNRMFAEVDYIPGHRRELKPKPQVVLVLDTSGSMWSKHYINQMVAMARMLFRQEKLAALYFCDTTLHKYNFNDSSSQVPVVGGGGTELDIKICEEIQEREKLKEGWELVYATDEFCPGLESAKKDKRWKIHIVNVPKMLGENH